MSFFSNIFGGGDTRTQPYDPAKLKPLLKMGLTRLKLVQNKRRNELQKSQRELAELLKTGNIAGCRVRVESVMREESACNGLEILGMLTDLICSRLPSITNAGSTCPPEMKEAISSILWANPYVGNKVAEFNGIKSQLTTKFGAPFVDSAMKNTELSVHEQLRAAFDPEPPSEARCVKYMESICTQFCIPIDPEVFHSDSLLGARSKKGGGGGGGDDDDDDDEVGEGEEHLGFSCHGYWIPFVSVPKDDIEAKLLALKRAWS